MALQSRTKIYIKDIPIYAFERLVLTQSLANHHHLEIVCRMDVLEPIGGTLSEESKKLLGNRILVTISSGDGFLDYGELEFQGVVTEIKSLKTSSRYAGDNIVIKAMSPTIFADDGPNNFSYLDTSISDIVTRTFSKYNSSGLDVLTQPTKDMSIHYSVQQNESSFRFVARLAAQYGQWLYYNGKELVFGKPETEEIKLRYKYDLMEYDLTLVPRPSNHLFFTNDYLLNEIHEKSTENISSEVNGYSGFVADKAKELFVSQTHVFNNVFVDQDMRPRFEEGVTLQKKSTEINQVKLTGISDNPGVKLGSIVCVEDGNFRVTKVTHTNNMNGDYSNHFEAVTAESQAYPLTNINAFPHSQSQIGIVKENNDPEALGRVKIQFPWQKQAGTTTPWIRIASVHAGSGKGFYSIPELDEDVIVDFIGGNAESPYVLGALWNGQNKPPVSNSNNDIKVFQTKSGCSMTFDDEKGSITLKDKSGSSISLDGSGNISINASSGEVSVIGPKEVSLSSDDEVSLSGKKEVSIMSDNEVSLNGSNEVSILSNQEVFIKGTLEVSINSDVEVKVTGLAKAALSSSGVTSVEGTIIKLN